MILTDDELYLQLNGFLDGLPVFSSKSLAVHVSFAFLCYLENLPAPRLTSTAVLPLLSIRRQLHRCQRPTVATCCPIHLVGVWQDQHGAEHGGVRCLVGLLCGTRCVAPPVNQETPYQTRRILGLLTMLKHH